jgi:hypothetical protein
VTDLVDNVRNERTLAKQKELLATGLYGLEICRYDWNMFVDGDPLSSTLSETERRHSVVVLIEYLTTQLLLLTGVDDLSIGSSEMASQTAPMNCNEEQALYYVGGFIVRKLLRNIRPDSPLTKEVISLLNSCVADESTLLPAASEWTERVSRGGLNFISTNCHDLFVSLERFAASSKEPCVDFHSALSDTDIDANVFRLAFLADCSDEAHDYFRNIVLQEFFGLRGKAIAKKLMENAIASDSLLQERRGIRSKLQRLETQRGEGATQQA